jgi:DNA-binding Lrp family transcriptional regulator
MDTLIVDKNQLVLLRDPKNMPLLQLLMTPHTPSEAAKHFGLSSNALHYRFKKLSEAKLIKGVEQRGNRRKYQVVAHHFKIDKTLVEGFESVIPEIQKEELHLVSKHFLEQSEKYFRNISADKDKPYLHFWLRARMKPIPYKPVFMSRELRLSEEEYCHLMALVTDFLKEARINNENNSKLKNCTMTLLMCEGGAISGKTALTEDAMTTSKQQLPSAVAQSSANKPQHPASKHRV